MDLKISGLHVLITGSAGDIGRGTAEAYLAQGCTVSLHYRTSCEPLQGLLDKYPDKCATVQADAANESEVIACIKSAVDRFGPIHILVVNHAIFEGKDVPIWEMELSQFQRVLNTNLTGTFLFAREFTRQLKQFAESLSDTQRQSQHAAVVMIGSTAGKFGEAFHLDYAASKSAMMYGFMKSLKNEIVYIFPRAIVNTVAPGWVHTKMAEQSIAEGKHLKALKTMPLRKLATVEDVSNAVLVASSPVTSAHSTGNITMVHGGMEGRVLWSDQ